MERDFRDFHGDNLSKKPNVFQTLYDIIAPKIQHLNIPKEVVLYLIRTRTYIRLNNLNNKLANKVFKKKDKTKKTKNYKLILRITIMYSYLLCIKLQNINY